MSVKRKPRKTGKTKKRPETVDAGNGATQASLSANGARAFSIKLDDDVREYLSQLGEGSIAAGVRRCADIAKRLNY
jgi:hypothetical protein